MENALTSCQHENHYLCKCYSLQRYPVQLKFNKIHNFDLLLFMSQSEFESEIMHITSVKYVSLKDI